MKWRMIYAKHVFLKFKSPYLSHIYHVYLCPALVVGSDDVASSYSIGVLTRRQVGRREGGRGAREVASY